LSMRQLSIVIINRLSEDPMYGTISNILELDDAEFIYVVPTDTRQITIIRLNSNIMRVEYPNDLQPDIDRIIGAAKATGECIVFTETGYLFHPGEISNMIAMLRGGASMVLRSATPRGLETNIPADAAAGALNRMLNRPDLGAASLTRFPHALRRDVINSIGIEELRVPPKFFAKCILKGIPIETFSREVGPEPIYTNNNQLAKILGDHLEAIHEILNQKGNRGGFTDLNRQRRTWKRRLENEGYNSCTDLDGLIQHVDQADTRDLSVIIPASNEESTIERVLQEVERLNPKEIIVVVNGSTDRTAQIAKSRNHLVLEFHDRIGHDVGRSIGASIAKGGTLLFVDADIVIPATEFEQLFNYIELGYDMALNNIDPFVCTNPWDSVSLQKLWLNICMCREDLGTASFTAVPHAIRRGVFEYISPDDLAVPPKAYAKLLCSGVRVAKANSINVVTTNRIHELHGVTTGRNMMEELIVGDNMEAIQWLQDRLGPRGFFGNLNSETNVTSVGAIIKELSSLGTP
jgi:hypothetical protein